MRNLLVALSAILAIAQVAEEDREPYVMVWTDCQGRELVTSANYAYWWLSRYVGGNRCRWHYWPWIELREKGAAGELRYWLPVTEELWLDDEPLPSDGGWEMTDERRWACEWCD